MLEIYLLTSLAPITVATLSNRELGGTGQNYIKSLFAVGFQVLLSLVCVAIYAVLIQGIATSGDPIGAIWGKMCIRDRRTPSSSVKATTAMGRAGAKPDALSVSTTSSAARTP